VRLVLQDSNRRCWGSPNSIGTAWRAAPDAVREFLLATPFGLFMSIIPEHVQRSQRLIAALAERWFDTTHTFHWSWGEMTMTPLDVFVLTGIPAGGRPIEVSPMIRITEAGVEAALGWCPGGVGIPHGTLIERLRTGSHHTVHGGVQLSRQAVRQFARAMILLLIQECFVARGGDEVGLFWLVLLQDFSAIHTWDWSGLILSVLYESMDSFSRLVSTCHRGLSMLWEVR